jgi:hypothetical protein
MLVTMITTAASPEHVLEAGKTYNLPSKLALLLVKSIGPHGAGYARLAAQPVKMTPVTPPDPQDVPELPDEDELTELDDEDADEE